MKWRTAYIHNMGTFKQYCLRKAEMQKNAHLVIPFIHVFKTTCKTVLCTPNRHIARWVRYKNGLKGTSKSSKIESVGKAVTETGKGKFSSVAVLSF